MRVTAFILLALNVLSWGYLVSSGVSDLSRHVPGETPHDRFSQVAYYLGVPATFAVIVLIGVAALLLGKRGVAAGIFIGCIVALPIYLYYYGGGV